MQTQLDFSSMNTPTLPERLTVIRGTITFDHIILHPILYKYDLVVHYQLTDNRALRKKVLTDPVLELAGIKPADFIHTNSFTAAETARLVAALGITWLRTAKKA